MSENWSREKAKAFFGIAVDDGGSDGSGEPIFLETFSSKEEKTLYYELLTLIEGILRECAKMVPQKDWDCFTEMIRESDFKAVSLAGQNEEFNRDSPEFFSVANKIANKTVRLGNKFNLATEMSATLSQSILQRSTRSLMRGNVKLDMEIIEPVLSFSVKMAHVEILRLLSIFNAASNISLLETLIRWRKTFDSEYFERIMQNYMNNPKIILELPSKEEAEAVRLVLYYKLRFPAQMPLLYTAMNVYDMVMAIIP